MNIFVYEHFCASTPPSLGRNPLEVEGRAMLTRVLTDLSRVPGTEIITCLHREQWKPIVPRLEMARAQPTLRQAVMRLAAEADRSLIIAPESDGILVETCQWVVNAGGTLLGPRFEEVALFADKFATANLLGNRAVPTTVLPKLPPMSGPLIMKPRRGAGCQFTALGTREQANSMMAAIRCLDYAGELIAQPFWPGLQASIALVARPSSGRPIILPGVEQLIQSNLHGNGESADSCPASALHWLGYQGGRFPLPESLEPRARALAEYVHWKAPELRGFVGIDIILAPGDDGAFDRVVEVNPRLTTSYTGYSRFLGSELMGHLLLDRPHPAENDIPRLVNTHLVGRRCLRFHPDGEAQWEAIVPDSMGPTSR